MGTASRRPGRLITQAELRRLEPEAEFEARVVQYAELRGWEVVRFSAPLAAIRKKILLDLYMTHPVQKRAVWLELKREGEKPTPKQWEFMEQLARAGVEVQWYMPSDWPELEMLLAMSCAAAKSLKDTE